MLDGLQSNDMDIIRNQKMVTEGQGDTATGSIICARYIYHQSNKI